MNEDQFELRVDGKLQKQRIRKLYKAIKQASVTLSHNIAQSLAEATKNLSQDIDALMFDSRNGTHLYAEKMAKVKAAKYQQARQQYGL